MCIWIFSAHRASTLFIISCLNTIVPSIAIRYGIVRTSVYITNYNIKRVWGFTIFNKRANVIIVLRDSLTEIYPICETLMK